MPVRLKKFIGTIFLLIFIPFYALLAMFFASALLPGASFWIQFAYYMFAGLLWVLPAGIVVTWMVRPPKA